MFGLFFFFFQAEDGIRDLVRSRGLGDVYKRQLDDQGLFSGSSAVIGEFNVVVRVRDALLQQVDVLSLIHI